MATRSRIGIRANKDDKIKSFYCHWDGYIAHNGKVLYDYYNSEELVNALMKKAAHGGISFLDQDLNMIRAYDEYEDDYFEYFTEDEIINNNDIWIEYFYVYDIAEKEWYVFGGDLDKLTLLKDEIEKIENEKTED